MRLDVAEHRKSPWRVHDITADFQLDELWQYPIVARADQGEDFAAFCAFMDAQSVTPGGLAGALFRLRGWLGKVLGWDRDMNCLPIPGCAETSLGDRLEPHERAAADRSDDIGFVPVYQKDDERLVELSNGTVHAALHIGWVELADGGHAPRLAVYWKSRGWLGNFYMAAVTPFRVYVVYPAMMRFVASSWAARDRVSTSLLTT